MQKLQNTFKCILAAFIFFTRIPFWRIANVEKRYFERIIPFWPLVGWLTGGVMTMTILAANSAGLSVGTGVMLALISRVLVTGALHEDGFADFCDGFGGGTSRQRTLDIMKDSHIGTYGVLGLVLYYMLIWNLLSVLFNMRLTPFMFIAADAACKYISSQITIFLPYARKEYEAKSYTIYAESTAAERIAGMVFGLLPITALWCFLDTGFSYTTLLTLLFFPAAAAFILFSFMRRRIGGYTGDCCGATFIITETVFYLTLFLILKP